MTPGNAALHFDREPYDAALPRPMGRNSAGEGFLRGFLAHAEVDRFYMWNAFNRPREDLEALLDRLGPMHRPVTWIGPADRNVLDEVGAVFFPTPELQQQAWARRLVGGTHYSLTGITHTTAETHIMDEIAALLTAPIEPWDALICTSTAVRASVETELAAVAAYLDERFGVSRMPPVQLVTIPLGIHAADFVTSAQARKHWRDSLDIPEDAAVALYFGRFSVHTKMNPAPMGLALQLAAEQLGQPVYWVLYGSGKTDEVEDRFRAAAAGFCPDVILRFVADTPSDERRSIWSVADLFISLSDNMQETFGLTPVEAMAAGLPCVVSDWDGYRDTVRHGVDGFRIRTIAPRPGLGADLAFRYAHKLAPYESYFSGQSQLTAVDIQAAAEALTALFRDADLRARMGEAARIRAVGHYDWRTIIPQYQTLWAELARRRAASPPQAPRSGGDNPWRLDPFTLFAAYPTQALSPADTLSLPRRLSTTEIAAIMAKPSVRDSHAVLPTPDEVTRILAIVAAKDGVPVGPLVSAFPPPRRPFVERGLVWLAKYGLLRISERRPQS